VSAEHARILFDEALGGLVIVDGSDTKPSTNGTWYRLSEPSAKSEFFAIEPKMEVLVGTVRFQVPCHACTEAEFIQLHEQVSEAETIMENPVPVNMDNEIDEHSKA
jgi:hypothetical protein